MDLVIGLVSTLVCLAFRLLHGVSTTSCICSYAKPIEALLHPPIFLTSDVVLESWQYSQRVYPHFDYPPKPSLPRLTRFVLAVRPAILHLHPRC